LTAIIEAVKTCGKCKETLPVSFFNKNKTKSDGFQVWCRPCHAPRVQANFRGERTYVQGPNKRVVSYGGAHDRVRLIHGWAHQHECVDCGQQAHSWSYMGGAPDEHTELVQGYFKEPRLVKYSCDPSFYEARCTVCHVKFDQRGRK
jgi:hypothetical protein